MQDTTLDHQEVEWQFDAADLTAVERWLEERSSAPAAVRGETKYLTDTYYDTEDWRFYRAGYALRVRRDGESVEATMKALASPEDGGLKRRREISEPLKSGGVKTLKNARGPVGERVRLLSGGGDLRRLFEVRTRRKIFELRPEDEAGEPDGSSGEVVVGPEGDIRLRRTLPRRAPSPPERSRSTPLGASTGARRARPWPRSPSTIRSSRAVRRRPA